MIQRPLEAPVYPFLGVTGSSMTPDPQNDLFHFTTLHWLDLAYVLRYLALCTLLTYLLGLGLASYRNEICQYGKVEQHFVNWSMELSYGLLISLAGFIRFLVTEMIRVINKKRVFRLHSVVGLKRYVDFERIVITYIMNDRKNKEEPSWQGQSSHSLYM